MSIVLVSCLACVGLTAGLPAQTRATSRTGRALSDAGLADLSAVIGERPWHIHGASEGLIRFEAYLTPTITTPALRRGTLVYLLEPSPTAPMAEYAWKEGGRTAYAQVAVAGRAFDDIQGDSDQNRPFAVDGAIPDRDILDVIAIVRSSTPPLSKRFSLPVPATGSNGSAQSLVAKPAFLRPSPYIVIRRMGLDTDGSDGVSVIGADFSSGSSGRPQHWRMRLVREADAWVIEQSNPIVF